MTAPKLYSVEHMLPFSRAALKVSGMFSSEQFAEALFAELSKAQVPGVVRGAWPQSTRTTFQYGGPTFPVELRNGVAEIFWYLIHQGYVLPEWRDFPATLTGATHYRRTERGTDWVNGADPMPEDTVGYVQHLNQLAPKIDSIVLQYVSEGLGSFNRKLYFAAAVMLGAASEKEIYLLGNSLVGALRNGTEQTELREMVDKGRSLARLLTFISRKFGGVTSAQRAASNGALDGAETHLASLFESIRVQRNDAVHPNTGTFDERSVRMAYQSFPGAVQKAEELGEWCGKNANTL
jgi:hypothetical protein